VLIISKQQVEALDAMNKEDIDKTSSLLRDYIKYMELLEQ
jgi:hypothetical protein